MQYNWNIRCLTAVEQELQQQLERELNISSAAARMLVVRGIQTADEARQFIRPSLDKLHDPFLMKDMDKAVERLHKALTQGEKILIYGDYDVDGTTAVALMYRFLSGIGRSQSELLDGTKCLKDNAPLPNSPSGRPLPNNQQGVPYPLAKRPLPNSAASLLLPLTQLLAMSIASDIVPITGENRILAHFGIRQLISQPFAGAAAVTEVAGLDIHKMTISELAYKIGPRINACGRMKSGRAAVELLLTDDPAFARQQAEEVNQHNEDRRDCDAETTREALEQLQSDPTFADRFTTVVYAPHWLKGVLGIVASRLIENYYRPTIVLAGGEDGIISGSARSVGGFDVYAAIDSCSDLLTNFGGHKYAAGLSMHLEDLPKFCERFEAYVASHICQNQLQPTLEIESELQLGDITRSFYNVLRHLEPFGPGNPRPLFVSRRLINHRDTRAVGKHGEHLRLDVTDRRNAITGIAFGRSDMAEYIQNGNAVDICYELNENTYNHHTTIQMMVHDIKPSLEVKG